MYLYVEMWNVTQKWMKLPKEERKELLTQMQERIDHLRSLGVENVGWGMNDEHTPYRGDYRYMAVWKIPSITEVKLLEESLEKAGWYQYFSQANSRGKIMSIAEATDFLLNLEENSTSLI